MTDVSPHDRELFEARAIELYREIVTQGSIRESDERLGEDVRESNGAGLLIELGLLVPDPGTRSYVPSDPAAAQTRIVGPLHQQGAAILEESSRWANAFGTAARAWRQSPAASSASFTEFRGHAIGPFIAAALAEAEFELLTAQPQTGRDPQSIADAALRDTEALARGIKQRTLYQHAARHNRLTVKYVAAVTSQGAEVRTLDEFFQRLIVIDRRLALIPSNTGTNGAVAIREPSVVAYLVDVFERFWSRARPFTSGEDRKAREPVAEQRAMTIRMLRQGYADVAAAKRVGVSPRTYAGYVADLKAEYGADTRFQLGYVIGQSDVTGVDDDTLPGADGTSRP